MSGITINLANNLNKQKLKNIAIIFTFTIKGFCRPTSIFVGFYVAFMHSKTTLKIKSRTNILFKAVLTDYKIDNATIDFQKVLPNQDYCSKLFKIPLL